jgi:integrase
MALERGSSGPQSNHAGTNAGTTPGSLLVHENRSGTLSWHGKWRHQGQQIRRSIGLAHLKRRRTPREPEAGEVLAAWEASFYVPRTPPQAGALLPHEASAELRRLISEHADEQASHQEPLASFQALVADWLTERAQDVADGALKASSLRDYQSMLVDPDAPVRLRGSRRRPAWLMRAFGELRVDEIDLAAIEAFEAKLKTSSLSPRTRLKYSIVLRMLLDHAVRRNVIAANPMASRGRRRNSRLRKPSIKVYDIELVEAIAAEAGGDVGEMIRLAAYSGLRQSELLALRWRDIKWAASVMQVNERYGSTERDTDVPKSNQVRSVPLSEQSNDLLERVQQRDQWTAANDLVFGQRDGDPRRGKPYTWSNRDASAVRKTYKAARDKVIAASDETIAKLRWHDLRHTFGSTCAAAGVPLSTIQAWMGHSDITTTQIYIHFQPQHDDAERLTAAFMSTTKPKLIRLKGPQ